MKRTQKLIGLFFALILVLGLSVTAMAAESPYGVRADSVVAGDLTCTVDGDGVLTWTDLPGATSYDLNIWMKGGLVKSETGLTSTSYDLEAMLDGYKKDSGGVKVTINVWGGTGRGGSATFMYSSPYPKLEAPTNLRWDVNGNPDWDDVANADGYTIYLYQPSGGAYTHYDLDNTSYFNCAAYHDLGDRVRDGWYFAVRATSTGDYRPSEYNESYRKGHVQGSGLRAGSVAGGSLTFTVNENGYLTWTPVQDASVYTVSIWTGEGLFLSESQQESGFPLQAKLNAYKKNSGTVRVSVSSNGSGYPGGTADFLYSSPYGKLEAPAILYWNGNMAGWSAVDGAESYTVYLYQPSGGGYNHWTTKNTYFDFSAVAGIGEGWFFAVKATAINSRDSVYNESPRNTGPVSTTLYDIGAYVHDATNDTEDVGGQVYLETNVGTIDWSNTGGICQAIEGTAVRMKAQAAPGYVFVEWRQGTQGQTISKKAEYSFTATEHKDLYAIFREVGNLEIAEVVGKFAMENVPHAGKEVSSFLPNTPDGADYSRKWDGSEWLDENGMLISANNGHHYDRGYEFEAGRSYTTDFFYFEADNGYTFAEDTKVYLEGPDPSMWDYEITGFNHDRSIMYVKFTFRIPGERDYPDINKVSLVYYGTPKDGAAQPDPAKLIYNNCAITREEWNSGTWGTACTWDTSTGKNKFVSGNTYVHMIELTALPGYHFSEDLLAQKGMQGEEEYGVVSLSADRTVATVTYTYNVDDLEAINTVTLDTKAGNEDFYLIRGGDNLTSGLPFTTFYTQQNAPYDIRFENYYEWYDVETEKEVDSITAIDLEVGKKYRLEFDLVLKDEYVTTRRFAESPTLVLNDYQQAHASFVDIETEAWGSGEYLRVYITYTVQPKPGEGKNPSYPITCYTYDEFKYAMENDDIRYVALGNINKTLPVGGEGLVTAIHVNGIKNLYLLGDATFTAPANVATTYAALLHTTQNTTLNISGTGSLAFKAVASNSYNAVIYNQGGSVNISGGMLIGSYNTAVYGKAIWQEYGELRISGGTFNADNALAPLELPRAATAVAIHGGQAWIEGGTFRTRNWIDTIDKPYGLEIGANATVDLSGGTFYGIKLPTSSTPLANYMDEDLYTPLSNENWFNPDSEYSQTYTESDKIVRIAWLIDHVDVHVNAPVAGVDIAENYFNIPTSGCQATMYYPQWYKNGEPVTYGTFEAGASYKVVVQIEVKPGYGAEFTNGVTVAINNKSADVDRLSAHWIEVEYDFGTCPNVVPDVALSVYAPKENNTVSFSIGDNSSAYQAMGAANSASEYREWMVSDTGAAGTYQLMKEGDKFVSGKYYKIVVWVQTANGYEFPLYDNGISIQPDVSATVNGYYASVTKAYEQDPSRIIEVEYNFGMCNDDTVEQIAVVDVTAPVAGERPNYTYNILGNGYKMNTAKNAYTDAYWLNPAENWYYIKNGIGWWDVTEEDWVYEHETFIPGHEYEVNVYLITEDGYEFAYTPKNYENATTATVNGKTAEVEISGGYWSSQRQVEYTFDCQKKSVSSVLLYDLDAPQDGKNPDTAITTAYPELYTVEKVTWFDCEGTPILPTDTFEQGVPYKVEVKIVPTQYGGVNACTFINENFKIYLDGNEVGNYYTDEVYVSSNAVYLYYTFRKGASAPEAPSGTTVSGSAVSWNDTDDAVYLLYSSSTADSTIKAEWAAGSYNALYTATKGSITDATVDGKAMKSQTFTFEEVADGTYKLVILKPGKYVPKIVEVTVGGSPVSAGQQKLWLYGDVNYDGSVNNLDILQINRNISSLDSIFDAGTDEDKESRNVAANVTALISGDTEVNNLDVLQINRYISSLDSIFDTMK